MFSVVDPNSLTLNPDPEFRSNLEPDPGVMLSIFNLKENNSTGRNNEFVSSKFNLTPSFASNLSNIYLRGS